MSVVPVEHVLSVTELNGLIRSILEADRRLAHCVVSGEISNFKHHSSGHMYFTLKDTLSRVRAVMFTGKNRSLKFRPQDGMRVTVTGAVSVFDRDGSYQIYVDDMQPDGIGALYVAFEQLKARLESEGLFAAARKRPLPPFPRTIGVVTSPTGAVIRDICSTLRRRYPHVRVILSPAQVQGPTAASTLVRSLEQLIKHAALVSIDAIIIARGGGSLEELWPFNEEVLARAISACPIPVISAVGHETDFTIADFVADLRAATPTAAAELVAPMSQELRQYLRQSAVRAEVSLSRKWAEENKRLATLERTPILHDPARIVRSYRQTVDFLETRLEQHARRPLARAEKSWNGLRQRLQAVEIRPRLVARRTLLERLQSRTQAAVQIQFAQRGRTYERVIASLQALNPLAVLSRGYSVVYDEGGDSVVTSVSQLRTNQIIRIRVQDGQREARITEERGQANDRGIQAQLDI